MTAAALDFEASINVPLLPPPPQPVREKQDFLKLNISGKSNEPEMRNLAKTKQNGWLPLVDPNTASVGLSSEKE